MIEFVKNLAFQMPDFIHDYGDSAHHQSLMRTVEIDEDYAYIPYSGNVPPKWRWEVHEFLDYYVFYPVNKWLRKLLGDGDLHHVARAILGFFWGFNCCFPRKDVVLYTVWYLRGCDAVRVWKKVDGEWRIDDSV